MHYQKIKGNVLAVIEHDNRGQQGISKHNHSNEKIDVMKTKNNYDLRKRNGLSAKEFFNKRFAEIEEKTKTRTGKAIRKDAVKMCSWVLTVPSDLPKELQKDFFQNSYEWFANRYGEKNVVSACVHLDETTPHMHFDFIPIVEDKGIEKLCAKNLETKFSLKTIHQQLQKHLEQKLNCEVNILNGATANGNKTVQELKAETLQKENEKLKRENEKLKKENKSLQRENEISKSNLLSNIPKLELKELPSKPKAPDKPVFYDFEVGAYTPNKREIKRENSQYDKDLKNYEKKIIPNWEKECSAIKAENELRLQEWESKYRTVDNLKKAENQLVSKLSRVEEEKKKIEQELKQQEENQKKIIEQVTQRATEQVIQDINETARKRVNMSFDEVLNYVESKLKEEREQEKQQEYEEDEEYNFEDDFIF